MNQLFAKFGKVEGMNAKSNVIVSLLWLFSLTLIATITSAIWIEKEFILYALICFLGIEILAIIIAYAFFAFKDPDCLRSETFTLNKIAMEKGHLGDNAQGLIENREHEKTSPVIIEVKDND